MIQQDEKSWNMGRADASHGAPSKCPKGLDRLAYASGYIEGQVQRVKAPRLVWQRAPRNTPAPEAKPVTPRARRPQPSRSPQPT